MLIPLLIADGCLLILSIGLFASAYYYPLWKARKEDRGELQHEIVKPNPVVHLPTSRSQTFRQ